MKKLLLLGLLTGLLSGCQKFLEETPESLLASETFFTSEENIEIAVNGIYDALAAAGYKQHLLTVGMTGTDQLRSNNNDVANKFHQMDLYAYGPSSQIPSQVWKGHYVGINRANTVINRVEPLLEDKRFNTENLQHFIAQAKFLRALYYFNLVRFYGAVPLKLTETASLTAEDVIAIERSPVLAVYQQIESDLLSAQEYLLLPGELGAAENGRVTKTAAWALLARVYSTWATYPLHDETKWAEAADYAEEVMTSGEHRLLDDFVDVFGGNDRATEVNDEVILAVKFSDSPGERTTLGSHGGIVPFGGANGNSWDNIAGFGTVKVEQSFYQSYDSLDTRRNWTISNFLAGKNGATAPSTKVTHFGIAKFRRDGSYVGYNSPYDYPLIRYADILLLYAEASAMANGSPSEASYSALNAVKRRAFGKPVDVADSLDYSGLPLAEFIDTVLQERSWELCYEDCSRWHDLIRYERLGEVVMAKKRPQVKERFNEDTHKLFPIPLLEMDSNPLMEQNPGYQ
ncbi:RagB/SusD family nutrient uptake outer membrane protein [Parapedobacter tibetensis]|uniref:RagB/SusD family nutrient uptake outer membrane protein n=1 Tax=Parapedobacter tibetensis TaxID=2972951 RepID=UPI00214D32A3|nr:RagB/SusD family nutrient uptake outer membrane protein [Parapedobacter tibetensis]